MIKQQRLTMSWLWSKLFGKPNYTDEIEYKRKVLQCSKEQLQVEVETQEHLEHTLLKYKQHLEEQQDRKQELQESRLALLEDVAQQKNEYEEKGEIDTEFERKCANTENFLNVDLVAQLAKIQDKMDDYEHMIRRLEGRIREIADVRDHTESISNTLQEELGTLEKLQTDHENEDDDSRMLIQLEEATIEHSDDLKAIPIDTLTQVDHPQQSITYRDDPENV